MNDLKEVKTLKKLYELYDLWLLESQLSTEHQKKNLFQLQMQPV